MKFRDLFLICVQLAGMITGIFIPEVASVASPWVLYLMMIFLFLSFTRIQPEALFGLRTGELGEVLTWSLVKLVLLPPLSWAAGKLFLPDYALPLMLLGGVSTGVVAPFLAALLQANSTRVMQVVVVTSLMVPITLPFWVKCLTGQEFHIPFIQMARMLGIVVCIPFTAALAARRYAEGILVFLNKGAYPLSLFLFFSINMGIFASYRSLVLSDPLEVLVALGVASFLAATSPCIAFIMARVIPIPLDPITGSVCLTFVNNVLIVVFSSLYFEARAPLVAAMYMVPFFGMVIPMRWLSSLGIHTKGARAFRPIEGTSGPPHGTEPI